MALSGKSLILTYEYYEQYRVWRRPYTEIDGLCDRPQTQSYLTGAQGSSFLWSGKFKKGTSRHLQTGLLMAWVSSFSCLKHVVWGMGGLWWLAVQLYICGVCAGNTIWLTSLFIFHPYHFGTITASKDNYHYIWLQ